MPIPPAAIAIHGITDADVADKPPFRQGAKSLADFLRGCDFARFNVKRFELKMLQEKFKRARIEFPLEGCRIIDALIIYHHGHRREEICHSHLR